MRKLQRKLGVAAKRHPGRRFHALYDRIYRGDVLWEAWERVRANRGAAGVDRVTRAAVEAYGVERMLDELQRDLRAGRYRPRRSATAALEAIRTAFPCGYAHLVEVDIRDFFGSIDHRKLRALVAERVSDRRVLKLVRSWLEAGVMEEGQLRETVAGTPQGGVISPLLSNIYLHAFDRIWAAQGGGVLVRYADDLVVPCQTPDRAEQARERVERLLGSLGLELHPEKTRVIDLSEGRQGFDFLGCHFRARVSGRLLERGIRRYYLHRWPSARSMKRIREKIRERTGPNRAGARDSRVVIDDLNPVLRGWGNYFRTGNASHKFVQVDDYTRARLRRLLVRRHGRQAASWSGPAVDERLVSGAGPAPITRHDPLSGSRVVTPRRPSLSRVRENRTHGVREA